MLLGVGLGHRVLLRGVSRRSLSADTRSRARCGERTLGGAWSRLYAARDGERSDFFKTYMGGILELGSAADNHLCPAPHLRRVCDAAHDHAR